MAAAATESLESPTKKTRSAPDGDGALGSNATGYGANAGALAKQATKFIMGMDGALHEDGGDETRDLNLVLNVLPGTFHPSPASWLTSMVVAKHADRWKGIGLDWGCGVGGLALLCARQDGVTRMLGLDYDAPNVEISRRNATENGLAHKAAFHQADSYSAFDDAGRKDLESLRYGLDFVVANPPASSGDDGFSYRRRVLLEACPFLKEGGLVVFQALSFYGLPRVRAAADEANRHWADSQEHSSSPAPTARCRYRFLGVAGSSRWMELGVGLGTYSMKAQVEMYGRHEAGGGARYYCGPDRRTGEHSIAKKVELDACDEAGFFDAEAADEQESLLTATQVLDMWESTGLPPLGRWQVYMFEWARCTD